MLTSGISVVVISAVIEKGTRVSGAMCVTRVGGISAPDYSPESLSSVLFFRQRLNLAISAARNADRVRLMNELRCTQNQSNSLRGSIVQTIIGISLFEDVRACCRGKTPSIFIGHHQISTITCGETASQGQTLLSTISTNGR